MIPIASQAAAPAGVVLKRVPPPDPAQPAEVVRYVQTLQEIDRHLEEAWAGADGLTQGLIAERRALVDTAIARQVARAGRRAGAHRADSFAALHGIFNLGRAPGAELDGNYRGQFTTLTLFEPLDSVARALLRVWKPWLGKRFHAATADGDNMFTARDEIVGRVLWPLYDDYQPFRPGQVTAFRFNTYLSPGVQDSALTTLKLDYDRPDNPGFLVRWVLDELVRISAGYYLGKAHLRLATGNYHLAAFFALRKEG
jgi:hypothetical protein